MAAAVGRRPRRLRTGTHRKGTGETHPLANLGFEGARHPIPERLPSARGEKTVSMRVIEMNDDTLDNIRQVGDSLKRLDLSHLNLVTIEEDFMRTLPVLERLDVSGNALTEDSFPNSVTTLENLIELSAEGNSLTGIPRAVQKLKNLARLKLAHNHVKAVDGLEKLRKLTMLVLDDNEIESFSRGMYNNLKKLEYLHCSNNRLRLIPPEVRLLRHLKDIDVSNNQLTYLPAEIFLLPRVDVLNASDNKIARLPSLMVKGRVKRMLNSVDLSNNLLAKFPDYLLMMTTKLDLSQNQIRTIPGGVIHKLDHETNQELCVDDNPLTNPPKDVCECGIKSIIQFFQEARAQMKVYQGIKILVVGGSRAGKTSLVQTIVDQQSRLTDKTDKTMGVDVYEAEYDVTHEGPMGRQLQMSLWDFGGDPSYLYPHCIFLQHPALLTVVFNMATYKADQFQNEIGRWIDWTLVRQNRLVMVVVGTHADKMRKSRMQTMCSEIERAIDKYMKRHLAVIEREIKKIESLTHISPALSEQLKTYINLLKAQVTIHPRVIPVSSSTLAGLNDLQKVIIQMASDKKCFPHVLRMIPTLWADVANYIDDKAWSLQVPLMSWKDYVEVITKKFGMKHLIEQITCYLHEIGAVLWFSDHPQLKEFIVIRPTWFCDLLKAMFRHDIAKYDFSQDENIKLQGFSQSKLEKARAELVEEGIMDKELLQYLWLNLVPPDNSKLLAEVVRIFVEFFEIGYMVGSTDGSGRVSAMSIVSDRSSSATTTATSTTLQAPTTPQSADNLRPVKSVRRMKSRDTIKRSTDLPETPPSSVTFNVTRILIPWLRHTPRPQAFRDEYDKFTNNPQLVANFRFPRHIPVGLFETLTVRAQRDALGLTTLYHWKGGLYAQHEELRCRLYLLRIDHEGDNSTCMRVEMRSEHSATKDRDIETLWMALMPFLKETDNLLSKLTGVRVERHMECPSCHALSFLGEWQTPKELQAISSRQCSSCKVEISSVYLIQPKEKKRVEEFLRSRIQEQKLRRQAEIENEKSSEKTEPDIAEAKLTEIAEEPVTEEQAQENGGGGKKEEHPKEK